MTSFRKYFTYHFKNTFLRCVVIAVLCVLPVVTTVWYRTRYVDEPYSRIDFTILMLIAVVVSTIIPILELLPFKNRRNMDTILFLPIDRRKLASVHFINGFIHVLLINAVTFITAYFVLKNYLYPFKPLNLFLLFAYVILGSLTVYSVTVFIFDRANTAFDGIIWLAIYSFVGCDLLFGIQTLIDQAVTTSYKFSFLKTFCFTPYFILIFAWNRVYRLLFPYIKVLEVEDSLQIIEEFESKSLYKYDIRGIVLWSILTILCIFGFIWLSKSKRPENIESISTSPFGYKVILPLLAAAELCCSYIDNIAMILVMLVIGYILYRRSFKFKRTDYISIITAVILPAILTLIAKWIHLIIT